MSSREEHNLADLEIGLSRSYDEVHALLDQFSHYPNMEFLRRHRKFLHHEEGIEYVRMRWGEEAAKSARQHILDDCGHVPNAADYYTDKLDEFGGKSYKYYLEGGK
jgi:DNA-binding GntR family transcriptional regulator